MAGQMTTGQPPLLSGCIDSHLATLVEDSTAAIVRLGWDGTIASWSPAAERMYGYLAAEVLGRQVPASCHSIDVESSTT
jgi:PAS domain S-box-containing protein